jgi:hypothetical protein
MLENNTKWSSLAQKWLYYLPPGRPSTIDLTRIKILVDKYVKVEEPKALVLGSTPEYRDLLHRLGFQVTVVDRNFDMVTAMQKLRMYNNKENVVIDDWLSYLPNHKREYSLILGDLIQGNLPYKKQEDLYMSIAGALNSDGLLIERVLTFRSDSPIYSSEQLVLEFANSPINLATLNNMMFKLFFVSDLVYEWKLVDVNRIYKFLHEKAKDLPGLEKYIPFLEEYIFGDGIVWYYGVEWDTIKKYYFKHLDPVEEVPDLETAYAKFVYIIATRSKQRC